LFCATDSFTQLAFPHEPNGASFEWWIAVEWQTLALDRLNDSGAAVKASGRRTSEQNLGSCVNPIFLPRKFDGLYFSICTDQLEANGRTFQTPKPAQAFGQRFSFRGRPIDRLHN
jgi:hypothetical protein